MLLLLLSLSAAPVAAFQTEPPQAGGVTQTSFERLEADVLDPKKDPKALFLLSEGDYPAALAALTPEGDAQYPWLRTYLEGAMAASALLVEAPETKHFRVFVPQGHEFLADYLIPSLERASDHYEKTFGHRARGKIRVEVYPSKESFSAASTLSIETLERSGAIGICKFHRLMILSPRALPLGYRWLDALAHEYMHLTINELTASKAELWLHEGTARYFETAYRLTPPAYLTPNQQTALLEAQEKNTLVAFSRMSPSMVYLKDQAEVSLAFAQVSHAVDFMIRDKGLPTFRKFFESLKRVPFPKAFAAAYGRTPDEFETAWKSALKGETWEKSKGTMSDEVKFQAFREDEVVGASAQSRIRLGDRMRQRGHNEAALLEYDKALTEEPDNAVILLKAARMRLVLQKKEEAIVLLRRAVKKNPNYATPMVELAQVVEAEEANALLTEANAINPFDPLVHSLWVDVFTRLGRAEDAQREKGVAQSLGRTRSLRGPQP